MTTCIEGDTGATKLEFSQGGLIHNGLSLNVNGNENNFVITVSNISQAGFVQYALGFASTEYACDEFRVPYGTNPGNELVPSKFDLDGACEATLSSSAGTSAELVFYVGDTMGGLFSPHYLVTLQNFTGTLDNSNVYTITINCEYSAEEPGDSSTGWDFNFDHYLERVPEQPQLPDTL